MDRLIYTALSGMDAAMDRQRAVANNLANASTPGFRAESFAVTPMTVKSDALEARSVAAGGVRGADMSAGRVVPTGQPLDIAVSGDALIALQAEDGAEVYSRRGDLSVSVTGVLQNGDGRPVMGQTGPITVPNGQILSIAKDGAIFAVDPATPDAPPAEIARIKLASPQGSAIAKDMAGFLRVVGGGVLPADATAEVTSGALEQSNVDSAGTLVDMIEAQRSFEQRAKLFSTMRELDTSATRLMSLRS
ncbi:Flagellar basal-body rod protein [Alteripontixanthobacter maritimus]|uniref:Flagellar basal-body rod protein FlgF n=1 Tax=Alteripontixanthobacter maritimus TaxID=2161824 RepID=A0A369Q2M7_9SPHN|nr:flagellar basal body rod protein FlgF [Alteripontixanthobacter maritimus]RDC59153.1 Flagellar basal-body rod protein [Alteripontixanthobacter maritimus]